MKRYRQVYGVRALGALIAIILNAGAAFAQSDVNLMAMMRLEGECSQLTVEGQNLACEGSVLHPLYRSGRVSLIFISGSDLVSFSGWSGPFDGRMITIVLDVVTPTSGEASQQMPVEGECVTENPYEGRPAGLFCEAVTQDGQQFFAEFLTNGSQPIVMIDNRE